VTERLLGRTIGCALLVLAPGLAHADDAGVVLSVAQCAEASVPSEQLLELARAEMAPRSVRPAGGDPGTHEVVAHIVLCDGSPDRARLVAEGHRRVERTMDLSDVVGDARARTLAVALAEMVASAAEEKPDVGPSIAAADREPIEPKRAGTYRAAPAPPVERTRPSTETLVGAGLAVREHVLPSTLLLGPSISIGGDSLLGDLLVVTASHQAPRGTVTLSTALAGMALTVLARRGAPTLALRIRAELGVAWASGTPASGGAQGKTAVAPQGDVQAEFALRARVTGKTLLELRFSGGYASGLVAESDGIAVASSQGAMLGAAMAAYWGL
jgi:hypothetical protein